MISGQEIVGGGPFQAAGPFSAAEAVSGSWGFFRQLRLFQAAGAVLSHFAGVANIKGLDVFT